MGDNPFRKMTMGEMTMSMIREGKLIQHKSSGEKGRVLEADIFKGEYKCSMAQSGEQTFPADDIELAPDVADKLVAERSAFHENKTEHKIRISREALLDFLRVNHPDIPLTAELHGVREDPDHDPGPYGGRRKKPAEGPPMVSTPAEELEVCWTTWERGEKR
jgi:hypothetical protein